MKKFINHFKSWRRQAFWSMPKQYRRQTLHVHVADCNPSFLLTN